MSAYSKTEYNRQKRLAHKIADIYSQARAYRLPHSIILDKLSAVWKSPDWKRANGYTKAYVRGAADVLSAGHYTNLKWGFVVDGAIMTVDEMQAKWPTDWHTRCENDTRDTTGNGTHFYPDPDHSKRRPF